MKVSRKDPVSINGPYVVLDLKKLSAEVLGDDFSKVAIPVEPIGQSGHDAIQHVVDVFHLDQFRHEQLLNRLLMWSVSDAIERSIST